MRRATPDDLLSWERQLQEAGYTCIAGVDEVGRGALAGPLVAAAVVLPPVTPGSPEWAYVRDSKTMTHARRIAAADWIRASGAAIAIVEVSCEEVDAIGIGAANRCAMERAVHLLDREPDMLLIDALTIDLATPQVGLIDGDAQSLSIAAASIVAKVYRDQLMIELDAAWPGYGFAKHKGYGVPAHLQALRELGPCPYHRRSYAPVRALCVSDA